MSKNISSLSGRDGKELDDPLWERLQQAAAATGTPDDEALTSISEEYLIGEAMHVFDDQVIVISVPDDGKHILYAFKEKYFEPRWRWLHNHAKELRARLGLDFPAFAQKMERSAKLGFARREAIRGR